MESDLFRTFQAAACGLAILAVFAVGIVAAVLKKRGWQWSSPILHGVLVSAILAATLLAVWTRLIVPPPETLTSDNVESVIGKWMTSDTGFVITYLDADKFKGRFALGLRGTNGDPFVITSPIEFPRQVHIIQTIEPNPDLLTSLQKLSPDESDELALQLSAELSRSRVQFKLARWTSLQMDRIIILDGTTTESKLLGEFDDLDTASRIARDAMALATMRSERRVRPQKPDHSTR